MNKAMGTSTAYIAFAALAFCMTPLHGQSSLPTAGANGARLLPSDLAILFEADERRDLPCTVYPAKPRMEYDFYLHARYSVTIPIKALPSTGGQWRVLFRVVPVARPEGEFYFQQRFSISLIPTDVTGEAYFPGEFTIGPGRYKVDWLLRDTAERVCSAHWELEAKVDDDYSGLPLRLPPDTAAPSLGDEFREPAPVDRTVQDAPLHAKVLVNFSPAEPGEPALKSRDRRALVSMLRSVVQEPRFGRFSLVAFSLAEEAIIFRQDDVVGIDFVGLGKAVVSLTFGTIDYQRLGDPMSGRRFLAGLLSEPPAGAPPDAVIIIGPKATLEKKVPAELLIASDRPMPRMFYLNYNADPINNPWRDVIGAALKVYKGLEYSVTRPADLAFALKDMMNRLRK